MYKLKMEKKILILSGLTEGLSIRSIERMTGVHRDTISRLLYRVGGGCDRMLDRRMRDLECRNIQVDEIWTYVGKKKGNMTEEEKKARPDLGDQYVFVALDADTKLVPYHRIGKRNRKTAIRFMQSLAMRLSNHVQITTDAFQPYTDAVDIAFNGQVDYAQLHKHYLKERERRYSPPTIIGVFHRIMTGSPQIRGISTSFVERQNLTMRMQMRRFTRLTNAFSKTLISLKAACALHFANYNFCRIHPTLRCTPAMEAGRSGPQKLDNCIGVISGLT